MTGPSGDLGWTVRTFGRAGVSGSAKDDCKLYSLSELPGKEPEFGSLEPIRPGMSFLLELTSDTVESLMAIRSP